MSKRNEKKYSLMLINNDNKTHSAFKKVMNISMDSKRIADTASMKTLYNDFKLNKKNFPFGLTEKRFLWQDVRNHSGIELIGNTVKKAALKNSFDGGFNTFYDNSKELEVEKMQRKKSPHVSVRMKILECLNSSRVINPRLDKTFDASSTQCRPSKKFISKRSSRANLSALFSKTPDKFMKSSGKKYFNQSTESNLIFTADSKKAVKTGKKFTDPKSLGNEFAGTKTRYNAVSPFGITNFIVTKKKMFPEKNKLILEGSLTNNQNKISSKTLFQRYNPLMKNKARAITSTESKSTKSKLSIS